MISGSPKRAGGQLRVVMDSDWQAHVAVATDELFMDKLGPKIRDDAKRFCPKRTEDLANSIGRHLEGHTLIVSATGSDEREYAAYVELGHRIYHPSTKVVGPGVVAPHPYLRPALYAARGE